MAIRFYTNCVLKPGFLSLTGPEAHHLAVVCRFRPGDEVCLFNGDGHEYPARIETVAKKAVELTILDSQSPMRELPFSLHVAMPLPKGDRAQFLIEKLTEMGVTTYTPLVTRYSVVQPREAKLEKLQRYVIEASKQCGRNVLMQVSSIMNWEDFVRTCSATKKWLAHLQPSAPMPMKSESESTAIVIGPEGGFTEEEVTLAVANGWQCVNMGPRIMRMETAALVLAAWVIGGQ